ncbi:MAG: ATP-binding cassette domain-containing protein, partial [Spirochaetaceae bacterium]|nr:ATP-binding cassette domain-containing protein [Spirochaetaceae bacterium]
QQALRHHTESTFHELHSQQNLFSSHPSAETPEASQNQPEILVDMQDVRVAWGDKVVLNKLTWQVRAGEHWLVRGPNGSGKTTLLELITGDNMQVFCNNVSIFGRRRGTGETIWELKEKMGIVSYRLHLEYRMVGGTDIEAVLLSGFHDSIGLYQQRSQVEQMAVERWLEIGGFQGRGHEAFSSLSYGEQRAILILRAAVKCPPLLILDEPCHGLDGNQRSRILHLLETIAATGTTTLLHVTHDVTEVLPCEQHILELESRFSPDDDEKACYRILNGV